MTTAYEQGWSNLLNGHLLEAPQQASYDLLITTDQNLRYQQNLAGRRLAIIVLRSTSWPRIQKRIAAVQQAIERTGIGTYEEIAI